MNLFQGIQGMKTVHVLIPVAALIVLAVADKTIAADVYQWADENGQIHFSDRAPQRGKSEIKTVTPASGKAPATRVSGLRNAEHRLLQQSRRREKKQLQARRRSVRKHAAGQSDCKAARLNYDRAKRKPGGAKSPRVRRYYDEMRELCR